MPAIAIAIDESGHPILRRPSGARLYHRGSRFGPPAQRRLDRNVIARLLFLAEALDRRTRGKGQHGGLLKAKGLDVLRALLRGFYCHRTGECFPSYDQIAKAASCCPATVRTKLRILEQLGIIETVRRKLVASFVSRVQRARYDCAVQTSNSYVFNIPLPDRRQHGDLGLPLLRPKEADAKFQCVTDSEVKTKEADALARALAAYSNAAGFDK